MGYNNYNNNNNNNNNGNGGKREDEVGAIWGPYKSKNGMDYFKIEVNGQKLIAFPNKKGKETHPDFRIFASKPSNNSQGNEGNGNGGYQQKSYNNGGYQKPANNGGYQKPYNNGGYQKPENHSAPSFNETSGSSIEEDEIPNF